MDIDSSALLPPAGATICVLDDDPSMLRAIDRLLSSVGSETQLFSEPLGFLSYARRHSVTIAVLDICMPGMSGLEVKKELQAISPKTSLKNLLWPDCNGGESLAAPRGVSGLKALPAAPRSFWK